VAGDSEVVARGLVSRWQWKDTEEAVRWEGNGNAVPPIGLAISTINFADRS